MGAAVILLVLGICVFLIWFFEAISKDFAAGDCCESCIDLRLENRRAALNERRALLNERRAATNEATY
jgi:hypothetical protein